MAFLGLDGEDSALSHDCSHPGSSWPSGQVARPLQEAGYGPGEESGQTLVARSPGTLKAVWGGGWGQTHVWR